MVCVEFCERSKGEKEMNDIFDVEWKIEFRISF